LHEAIETLVAKSEIGDKIVEELGDPDLKTRQHYSRATYALGCRGPLCGLREREYRWVSLLRRTGRPEDTPPPANKSRKNDELLRQVVRLYIEQHHRNQIDRLLGDM
jgi:hypothetical protein